MHILQEKIWKTWQMFIQDRARRADMSNLSLSTINRLVNVRYGQLGIPWLDNDSAAALRTSRCMTALTEINISRIWLLYASLFTGTHTWDSKNDILINMTKTKELVIGPWGQRNNSSLLSTQAGTIERVTDFKLLGVYIDSKLFWKKTHWSCHQ